MPSNGICPLIFDKSGWGALSALTDDGPPDKMTALKLSISVGILLNGWISQYMLSSLTRLAISWVYCDPKSKIRTLLCCMRKNKDRFSDLRFSSDENCKIMSSVQEDVILSKRLQSSSKKIYFESFKTSIYILILKSWIPKSSQYPFLWYQD